MPSTTYTTPPEGLMSSFDLDAMASVLKGEPEKKPAKKTAYSLKLESRIVNLETTLRTVIAERDKYKSDYGNCRTRLRRMRSKHCTREPVVRHANSTKSRRTCSRYAATTPPHPLRQSRKPE